MVQYRYLRLSSMYANGLENKRGDKAQSPTVALSISSGCRWVLSKPAINGGENPRWNDTYILQFKERYFKTATLTMILYHQGKNYVTILGEVRDIPLSSLTLGQQELQVLDTSGMHNGGILRFYAEVVTPPPPPQQSFTLIVHSAQGLKNVKSFLKRISVKKPFVRKMRPYVVVKSNLDSERRRESPIAENDGKYPKWDFSHKFTCDTSLVQEGKVNLTIDLHHRHKAKYSRGPSDKDIMIGSVEDIEVSPTEQRRIEHRVYTPKGKECGKLYVSVTPGEPEQQEQERLTPSPTCTWEPRIRPPERGLLRVRKVVNLFIKGTPPVSALAGVGIAAAVA